MTEPLAIVTGAASGIGLATAQRLAGEGYRMVLVDLDGERLEQAAGGIQGSLAYRIDVGERGTIEAMVGEIVEEGLTVRLLVNNAGTAVASTVIETSLSDWERIISVNLSAVYRACRAVLPLMVKVGGGVIINVASAAGLVGIPRRAAYCASKAGVIGLTRAIAVDHARQGIRVNAVCPGTVATEWVERILADADDPAAARRAMADRQLDGRLGTPEEVAAAIAFLASDEARFVNGASFVIDGGMTAV